MIDGIGAIVKTVGDTIDNLWTSDEEKLKIELQEKQIEAGLIKAQLEVNRVEAKHRSIFVAGWRPFIGWVGGIALAYQFLLYPLLCWGWVFLKSKGWVDPNFNSPPVFDAGPLFAIVSGMLGVAGFRTFEKVKKVNTDHIRERIARQ